MSRLISRWPSSFLIAVTLLLGTLSGTPAHADDLNLCQRPAQSRLISLPADDAPHDVHDEWYYTTGHLWTLGGKRYGFETVVFQLTAPTVPGGFITVGQFAVTDLNNGTFHHEFFGPLVGPFPPSIDSFDVTVGGLTMSGGDGSNHITASLTDNDGDYGIDLSLSAVKNPVYQADDGLIHYDDPNSSTQYYYSRPRMAAFGSVTSPDGTELAFGQSWFDHEYGTLPQPVNWEWFSIQLNDGREIMVYNLRNPITQSTYATFGSIQDPPPRCRVQSLDASDFTMSLQGKWKSKHTGITYAKRFGLSVPSRDMNLTLTPELADQEVYNGGAILPPYWEGTVKVSGTVHGQRVSGAGYVELVNYVPNP